MSMGRFEKAKKDFVVAAKANINRAKRGFSPVDAGLETGVNTALRGQEHWPYLAAKGGEHLVFSFDDPRLQGIMYKVNYFESLPVLSAWYRGETAVEEQLESMRAEMNERTGKLVQMRQYFGFDAVPPQRYIIKELPVTPALIAALRAEGMVQGSEFPDKLPVWVCIQRKVKKPEGRTYSLNGVYPEGKAKFGKDWTQDRIDVYSAAHDVLFEGPSSKMSQVSQERWVLMEYPELLPVWQTAMHDAEFKRAVQSTVRKLIRYTEETGQLLELAGNENMMLAKLEGEWRIRLLDVLPMKGVDVEHFREVAKKLAEGRTLNREQRFIAMNGLNTMRFINALALIAGIPERLHEPDIQHVPAETWRKEISKIFADRT